MATAEVLKLNRGLYYVGMPRELCSKSFGLPVSARFFGGLIETFTVVQADGSTVPMSRTHKELLATLGIAPATSTRSANKLVQGGFVSRAGAYSYTFNNASITENAPKWYCPLELLNSLFDIKDDDGNVEKVKLTKATCLVYAYFYTKLNLNHGRGCVEATFKEIAGELGICADTVAFAVGVLRNAQLIKFPYSWKGKNRYSKSKIRLKRTWGWFKNERAYRARLEEEELAKSGAISREEYYAKAQEQAQKKADKAVKRAEKNSAYRELTEELESVRALYLNATLSADKSAAENLSEKMNAVKIKRAGVLEYIGLSEEELQAEYYAKCKLCNDTGYLGDGKACHCYYQRKRGSPPRRKGAGKKAN